MNLRHLFDLSLRYDDGGLLVLRPFAGHEGQGFGSGRGRAEGERLSGDVRYSSYPRLRDDGVLMPDVRGVIDADEGSVLFEARGYVFGSPSGTRRPAIAAMFFRTETHGLKWLNDVVAVHEGYIDFADMSTSFPVYEVIADSLGAARSFPTT